MKRSLAVLSGAVLGTLLVGTAQAALIASDSFSSATTSGTGWTGGWTVGLELTTGLSHPSVASSASAVTRKSDNPRRPVLTLPTTGIFYTSFLIKTDPVAHPNNVNFANVTFFRNYDTEVFGSGSVWSTSGGTSAANFGSLYKAAGTGTPTLVTGSTPVDGLTRLFVEVIDRTNNSVAVYLDPVLTGNSLPATPSWSFTVNDMTGLNNVRLETTYGNAIDEIRIGTTLQDVMVVPEPAAIALMGMGCLGLMRRRRSAK